MADDEHPEADGVADLRDRAGPERWKTIVAKAQRHAAILAAVEAAMAAGASLTKAVQVLDFYHASSHLWAAARAYKGNSTAKQRQACIAWVKPMQKDLREGRVANVIQRLGKIKATGAVADEIAKAKKYFETHRKRMRYNWLRDRKALIGSGAMESVHAWVIQARCRLPGMRWSVDGANTMLRLRCAWASDTWGESFRQAVDAPPRPLANGLKLQT